MDDIEFISEATWRHFWHPVCTLDELAAARPGGNGPLPIRLLGERLVLARIDGDVVAFRDRCAHRSTALSLGEVNGRGLRCAYHGWLYDRTGICVEIPACPNVAIPPKARVDAFEVRVEYDLVWVRLDSSVESEIPICPAWDDETMKVVPGEPYTWPTSAGRRLENFVDLAHFPFVHPGTLGESAHTTFPIPLIDRIDGELRFGFAPAEGMDLPDEALMAETSYRIFMPFCVNLEFDFGNDRRSMLWMCASPIDAGHCRSFWFTSRDHDKDQPDQIHLEFQDQVLAEDLPVIEAQIPPQIPKRGFEVPTKADKVSMFYRNWLYEIEDAAKEGPEALQACIASTKLESESADKATA